MDREYRPQLLATKLLQLYGSQTSATPHSTNFDPIVFDMVMMNTVLESAGTCARQPHFPSCCCQCLFGFPFTSDEVHMKCFAVGRRDRGGCFSHGGLLITISTMLGGISSSSWMSFQGCLLLRNVKMPQWGCICQLDLELPLRSQPHDA